MAHDKERETEKDRLEKLKARGESCGTCRHLSPANPQNGNYTYVCGLKGVTVKRYNICHRHNEENRI
jgi:hypothetical protein